MDEKTKKLSDIATVTEFTDSDYVTMIVGGVPRKVPISALLAQMNLNESMYLQTHAFSIDVNTASAKGSNYVDVGGNSDALSSWYGQCISVLMDANGNYLPLSKLDNRYTENGTQVVDDAGNIVSAFVKSDFMGITPDTYIYVQTLASGKQLLWISGDYIPGGTHIPAQAVGMFKATTVNDALRSIPNSDVRGGVPIYSYHQRALNRSNNHGLAGGWFRNFLMLYMMGRYGQRSCQDATLADGTPIWGVGLDGSENTSGSTTDGWGRQNAIVCGATLSLGTTDGKSAVTDGVGGTCHKVKLLCWEDTWGHCWEFDGHRAHIGTKLYEWDSNWLPSMSSTYPTETSFVNVNHREFVMAGGSGSGNKRMLNANMGNYWFDAVPSENDLAGVGYNDYFWYDGSTGRNVLLWGGDSGVGSKCGLGCAGAYSGWSAAGSSLSARLDYHGELTKVTENKFLALVA